MRDRVAQAAIKAALEPIFEREFRESSFGFRPRRSCHQALSRVFRSLRNGSSHVVDADLRKFFDTIPHEAILEGLKEKVSDGKLLAVVESYLTQGVMEGWSFEPTEEGTPQGSVISSLLANIALHRLDVLAEENGFELVRYADDFVILCRDRVEAENALEQTRNWVESQGLNLHPEKTRIVDYGAGESLDFLGFTFRKGRFFARKKSVQSLRDKVRGKTKRTSGKSLSAIVSELNPILQGWYRYFKAGPAYQFKAEDKVVRRRLRALLESRNRRSTHLSIRSSQRWPNDYLRSLGLFSMEFAKLQIPNPL